MKKLGGKMYGGPKAIRIPKQMWEIQDGIAFLVDSGVLDPKLMFLLVEPRGSYPVVLLHEDFSKLHGSSGRMLDGIVACTSQAEDDIAKTESALLQYDIDWLLRQDGDISIAKNADGIFGTPAATWLTSVLYKAGLKPEEDPGAWRIDFLEAVDLDAEVQLRVVEKTATCNGRRFKMWAVMSGDDFPKVHILLGKASDIIKFQHREAHLIEEQEDM